MGLPVLMGKLREVMRSENSAQGKLDCIARLIASHMKVEVCSIYFLLPSGRLELYATKGLRAQAVHRTALGVGEGLVGDIAAHARPLKLADARQHPSFADRPETGEKVYCSFMGVPMLRSGRVMGVLAVQTRERHIYSEEEVEQLETVAMVLAEMALGLGLMESSGGVRVRWHRQWRGVPFARGLALGQVVAHEPQVQIAEMVTSDVRTEHLRLDQSMYALRASVDRMLDTADFSGAGEHREILETYRMFANDRGWFLRLHEAIDKGLTAEAAVEFVRNDLHARLTGHDPYLRERLQDLDDLANRLLRHLTGLTTMSVEDFPQKAIVVARNIGPAELLEYADKSKGLCGVVLEEGGATAHVTIVARAFGIPMVGRVAHITDAVQAGDEMIVDGDSGDVYLRPAQNVSRAYAQKLRFRAQTQETYRALASEPCVTRDGHRISLLMNAGLLADLPHLGESGAEGIGLFRTELQFMVSATFPRLGEQTALYREVLRKAGSRAVVFRTLDIGGDKILPPMQLRHAYEENPALGWRALRMALDRPALLSQQLRALLKAAAGGVLHVMFPMVTEVQEFQKARALLDKEVKRFERLGLVTPNQISVGVMLEVPSILWQLEDLLPDVDFVSVGSNDLMQFLFASDRGNERLSGRYDPVSPPALRVLRQIAEQCAAHEVPLTLCGEMAGEPLTALALAGLGYSRISMSAASIGPVKAALRTVHLGALKELMESLCGSVQEDVRTHLGDFARTHGVPLGEQRDHDEALSIADEQRSAR